MDLVTQPLRVLVVEDEVELATVVSSYFEREGFLVEKAFDGPSAVEKARTGKPDLIILDLMLPGYDGVEVCKKVRAFSDAYILMLTAREDEVDKIVGFAVGADDYLVKPFSPRELIARSKAILRRPHTRFIEGATHNHVMRYRELILDAGARLVHVAGTEVELTRTEFDLLAIMMESPKNIFSRRQLLESVWGGDWYGEIHVVDVHIGHLRKKLSEAGIRDEVIRTVRGIGYGLEAE